MNLNELREALENVRTESVYQGAVDNKIHHYFALIGENYSQLKTIREAATILEKIWPSLEKMCEARGKAAEIELVEHEHDCPDCAPEADCVFYYYTIHAGENDLSGPMASVWQDHWMQPLTADFLTTAANEIQKIAEIMGGMK